MGVGVHFALDSFIVVLNYRVIGSNGLISGPSFGSVSSFLFLWIEKRPWIKFLISFWKKYFLYRHQIWVDPPLILKRVFGITCLIKKSFPSIRTSWMPSPFSCCLKLLMSTLFMAMLSTTLITILYPSHIYLFLPLLGVVDRS